MKIRRKFIMLGVPVLLALPAWADVYKCVDDDGHVTYTNTKSSKGCKVLSQDQRVSTVPGRATPAPPSFPKVASDAQKARDGERRKILEQELAAEQQSLDEARRELAAQENVILPEERLAKGGVQGGKLDARLQTYRDKVALHERNIEALQKEIANLH